MLTSDGDTGRAQTCDDDVVHKAREWRNTADEEGYDGTPVCSILGRVSIHPMEVVHIRHGHIPTTHDEVAESNVSQDQHKRKELSSITRYLLAHENTCHWTQEDGVTSEES